jgi:predicted ATPase
VRALLDRHRLVTLTGSGGAGKTRLALQLGAARIPVARDGVRLVELAALEDGELFVEELASRFDVQAGPDRSLLDAVAEAIGNRQMLLVLDNCEHLAAAAADASRHLLGACRELRVLATSRVRLGVHGEALYRVPSLSIPDVGADVDIVRATDAVRLFTDRARLAVSDFEVTEHDLADVVSICRRLDGIPLALELAAARIGAMSPAQIVRRLDERFRLLADPDPGRSLRQQTLRAAIDWSHDLLDVREQTAFRRLSAFVTDFSLEAAERVCADGAIGEFDVVDLLAALVDKSIVAPERSPDGGMRYRLLESMREYGAIRLGEAGERIRVLERYLDWCADLAETLQSMQRRGDLSDALAALEQEEDHLRAALRFAIDARLPVGAGRIIAAVGYLWYVAGLHREGIQWCRELVETEPELPDEVRAGMLHTYGTLLGSWTRPDLGVELLGEEVALRRGLGDRARLAAALNNLGNLLHDVGRFDEAEHTLHEAIECFRSSGESASLSLSSLAFGHMHTGGYARAEELYTEALEEAVAAGNEYGIALATEGLGQCNARVGRTATARALLEEGRARFLALRVLPGVADADFHLALVDRAEGRDEDAARHLLASLGTPGAHWYDETRAWIAQVAASLVDDAETGASFVGAAAAWYDRGTVAPPSYIRADLVAARAAAVGALGSDAFEHSAAAGARLSPDQLIERVSAALRRRIGEDANQLGAVETERLR